MKGLLKRLASQRRRLLALALGCAALALMALVAAWIIPLPERLATRDSLVVQWRDGKPAHVFLSQDDMWRVRIGAQEVDARYVDALIALEDQRFWHHPGVDAIAIARALRSNISHGEVVSGASTLTMQLVRVLEPRPRTLSSKIIEALRAMQLELRLSKPEILEHYLRFAPYGRNIEGVDAAALAYFGHRATALSNAEIATLLAVPQAPNRRYPSERNAERLRQGRDAIARELLGVGALELGEGDHKITPEQALAQVLAQQPPLLLSPFPRELPHLAVWLKQRHEDALHLTTTLDEGTQRVAERLMRERHSEYETRGIHNGAVVITDHASMEVRALVGNFDFHDERHAGQIAGFSTPRSTGSLLKPVIMAMAMDRALVHPKMLVRDVPIERGAWTPTNFDDTFNGLVTLEDALARSLNIPFVELIEAVGQESLLETLRQSGFAHLDARPGHYGLGIAVGGVEATPLEVSALYGMLANKGEARALRWLKKDESVQDSPPRRLLGAGSAWLALQAMAQRERPDITYDANTQRDIHWKTGTSNNYRDAWSAGIAGELVAVAWLGNFSNASSPELIGSRAAAPLMFDLIQALVPHDAPGLERPEDALKTMRVCALSGMRPGPACEHTHSVDVPTASVPMSVCPYHEHIQVDVESGEAVRASCRAGHEVKQLTVATFPADVARWMGASDRARAARPEWAPGCSPPASEHAPQLRLPRRRHSVMLIPGIPSQSQRVPFEAMSAVKGELSWFVDGEFIGSTATLEKIWWEPVEGEHEVVVMDATGRASRRDLVVMDPRKRRQLAIPITP